MNGERWENIPYQNTNLKLLSPSDLIAHCLGFWFVLMPLTPVPLATFSSVLSDLPISAFHLATNLIH